MSKSTVTRFVRRRRYLLVSAAASIAALVSVTTTSGIGVAQASATKAPPAFHHVTVELWFESNPAYQPVLNQAMADFAKAYPGSRVKEVLVDPTLYPSKFEAASAAGDPPTLISPGLDSNYQHYIKAGLLTPLNQIVKSGFPKFYKSPSARLSLNGKLYAVPLDVNTLSVCYNKSIFAKVGLVKPATQSALIADASKLSGAGYTPMAVGEKDAWPGGDLFGAELAYTDKTGNALFQGEQDKLPWTAPVFLKAAQALQSLVKGNVFGQSLELAFTDSITAFGQGQAAMLYPCGNFDTTLVDSAAGGKVNYGLFPMPPLTASQTPRATGGPAIFFSIPSKINAHHQAADIAFLKILTDARTKRNLVAHNFIPSSPGDTAANKNPIYRQMLALQATARPRTPLVSAVNAQLFTSVQKLFAGAEDAAQLTHDLETAAQGH